MRISDWSSDVCSSDLNLAVAFTADHGTVTFPRDARGADWPGDALVSFDAATDALTVRIDASVAGPREALEGAVARHIDRFAFREAPPAFHWQRSGSDRLAHSHLNGTRSEARRVGKKGG